MSKAIIFKWTLMCFNNKNKASVGHIKMIWRTLLPSSFPVSTFTNQIYLKFCISPLNGSVYIIMLIYDTFTLGLYFSRKILFNKPDFNIPSNNI
jgi:hypothetical protein